MDWDKLSRPSVPSRRSRLILSAVSKPAQQQRKKAVTTSPLKAEWPRAAWLPLHELADMTRVGRQIKIPASATAKRAQ